MRAVDLDLFVNSASKGWNDGAKVSTPFAAFVDSFAKGIDQYYENQARAEATEGQRIQNEQAPYREEILKTQAAEAELKRQAIEENPDAFKDSIISKAQTDKAVKDQELAYQTKKTKLTEIWNSGDGKAIGEAYLSRDNKDVFTKDKALDEQFKSAYPDWAKETQSTYQAQERSAREVKTNEILYQDAVSTFEKFKPDYVANPDINIIKEKIKEDTGNPVSDSELFEKGSLTPFKGPKQKLKTVQAVDDSGKPLTLADGKTPKLVPAPAGKFGMEYENDPYDLGEGEVRNVFTYNGKQYDVGAGISADASKLFNTMQSSYRRTNYLDKGQFGTTDLTSMSDQKEKAQNEATAKAQAEANQSDQQIQQQRSEFIKGADVATQKWAAKEGLVPTPGTVTERDLLPEKSKEAQLTEMFKDQVGGLESKPASKSASNIAVPTPTPQVLATATAAARTEVVSPPTAGPTPTPGPLTPAQQNQLVIKQAQAVKASQFLGKYQKTPDKVVEPPVPPAVQATRTTASPYIPKNISTNIPYEPKTEAINIVASRPEMQGLSALTKAVAVQESAGINAAKSPTEVTGIMQVTGPTGRGINPNFDRTDSVQQAIAGARTLSLLADKYPNSPMLQLTAYNAGTVITNEAVRLAGTTDWSVVKNYMEEAGNSPRVQNAWYNDFIKAGFSPAKAKKFTANKTKEASTYAEKVIVNFPAFAFNADDNKTLQLLKQQGVFS